MKVKYKGFDLEAKREKCLTGYDLLYYTIYKDDLELVSSFEDSEETVRDKIKQLKNWVNDYITNPVLEDDDFELFEEEEQPCIITVLN